MRSFYVCLFALAVYSLPLLAQAPLSCSVNSGVPPIVRAEGRTELLGDLVVACSSREAGRVIQTSLTLGLPSTTVTSRLTAGTFSEAMVVLDDLILPTIEDPNRGIQKPELGVSAFQGVLLGPSTLTFAIKFTTKANWQHLFRITNVRADATHIGASSTLIPSMIQGVVAAGSALSVQNPEQTMAFILPALMFEARKSASTQAALSLPGCGGHNAGIASGSAATLSHILRFREGFQTAFKVRGESPQNIPGVVFNNESGFVDSTLPSTNGFNLSGLADHGTRLMARFSGVPQGVNIYVTVKGAPSSTVPVSLVSTDASGAGALSPLPATLTANVDGLATPLRLLNIVNGATQAVWEFDSQNPSGIDTVDIGVVYSYSSVNANGAVITATGSLAPLSTVVDASATAPIPRFGSSGITTGISFVPCSNQPNLVVESLSTAQSAMTGGTTKAIAIIRNVGTTNSGPFTASFGIFPTAELANAGAGALSAGSCQVASLAPGIATSCSAELATSVGTGERWIGLFADSGQQIVESSETDNRAIQRIFISDCYLQFSGWGGQHSYAGGAGSFVVLSKGACPWSLTAPPWVTLSPTAGVGPTEVSYRVQPNLGSARVGFIQMGDRSLRVDQSGVDANGGPPYVLVTDPAGSQMNVNAASTLPDGSQLLVTQLLLARSVTTVNACLVEYNHETQSFRLMTDNGLGWIGPSAANSFAVLANRQCRIDLARSFGVTVSGKSLVSVGVANLSLAGITNIYVQTSNPKTGSATGFQKVGSIDLRPPSSPTPTDVLPRRGSSEYAVLSARFANGTWDHYLGYLLLLPTPNVVQYTATGSCLIEYNRISHGVRLVDDAGTGWLGPISGVPITPSALPLSNSACTVDVASASVERDFDSLTFRVAVKMKAALGQVVGTFAQAFDVIGIYSGMTQYGSWINPTATTSSPGPRISATLPFQNSRQLHLSARASHTSGNSAIAIMHLRIGQSIIAAEPCHIIYQPYTNTVNLINKQQTAMVGPDVVVGTNTELSNFVCNVSVKDFVVSKDSTGISIEAPVIWTGAAGSFSYYANAFDIFGRLTHWVIGSDLLL